MTVHTHGCNVCNTCSGWGEWLLYSPDPLGNRLASTMIRYPTQSHYPDAEHASLCPILLMPSAGPGGDSIIINFVRHWFESAGFRIQKDVKFRQGNEQISKYGYIKPIKWQHYMETERE